MADQSILDKYEPTIGIECHVQLKTKSKLFARVSNDAREAEPNTTVSPICFGLPGVLPYLNEQAVELAVRAGLALNAKINPRSTFDRKHYFYPDLPKGYQITQYAEPIVGEGWVEINIDGEAQKIGIERAHLEEDAGKLTHPANADYSLVDLNRAGTPLLEIVSKPDIKSPAAAKTYARELYLLMKFADVSDVDLYHGHMRFDVNVSVAPKDSEELGTRAEVKNINSFRAVEKAAQFEFERQVELLEKGESIVQETRGWNEDKSQTFPQRSKEEAHDYRYFPEPDLPPVELSDDYIESEKHAMPTMPNKYRSIFKSLGMSSSQIEVIINDNLLAREFAKLVNSSDIDTAKRVGNWLVGDVARLLKTTNQDSVPWGVMAWNLFLEKLNTLSSMIEQGRLNSNGASMIIEVILFDGKAQVEDVAQSKQLIQVSDESEITKIVEQVIQDNPKAAEDVKNGEAKAIGFLVGQVMALSKGQANPSVAQELIKKQLGQK